MLLFDAMNDIAKGVYDYYKVKDEIYHMNSSGKLKSKNELALQFGVNRLPVIALPCLCV